MENPITIFIIGAFLGALFGRMFTFLLMAIAFVFMLILK